MHFDDMHDIVCANEPLTSAAVVAELDKLGKTSAARQIVTLNQKGTDQQITIAEYIQAISVYFEADVTNEEVQNNFEEGSTEPDATAGIPISNLLVAIRMEISQLSFLLEGQFPYAARVLLNESLNGFCRFRHDW